MILFEIFDAKDSLEVLQRFLQSKGFPAYFDVFINRPCLMIKFSNNKKARIVIKNDDTYRISLMTGQGHRLHDQVGVIDEMEVLKFLQQWIDGISESIDDEDEHKFKPASGMLFHFLKKILVDEGEQIISEIPDHEGHIRLRREVGHVGHDGVESTDIVVDREDAEPEGDWFEIVPEDDDTLTLEKEDGKWYLRVVDGKEFKY